MDSLIRLVLASAICWCSLAAATPLPSHITGTWTAPSARFGEGKALSLYFDANGAGMMVGFFRLGPDTHAFVAGPMATTLDGDTFVARMLPTDPAYAEQVARMVLTCHYERTDALLSCRDPNGVLVSFERRSTGMTADLVEAIETMRANLPAAYVRLFPPVPAR